jgi:hypothetical protein
MIYALTTFRKDFLSTFKRIKPKREISEETIRIPVIISVSAGIYTGTIGKRLCT